MFSAPTFSLSTFSQLHQCRRKIIAVKITMKRLCRDTCFSFVSGSSVTWHRISGDCMYLNFCYFVHHEFFVLILIFKNIALKYLSWSPNFWHPCKLCAQSEPLTLILAFGVELGFKMRHWAPGLYFWLWHNSCPALLIFVSVSTYHCSFQLN